MRRALGIAASVVVWGAIVFYLVWSAGLGEEQRRRATVRSINIEVRDSAAVDIVKSADVLAWIEQAGLTPLGKQIDAARTRAITDSVASHDFVSGVKSYVDLEGTLTVSLTQHVPQMRVITSAGYNFYVTRSGYIFPAAVSAAHYVPVVTGDFGLPFDMNFSGSLEEYAAGAEKKSDKSYLFLCKLINFVEYIGNDDFWNSQIVQINATASDETADAAWKEPIVELIPRVGDQVVLLGGLEKYDVKLARLMEFYRSAQSREGWNRWNHIDLRFDGQVVCSNRQ